MSILLHTRRQLAERHVAELTENRIEIGNKLKELYEALKKVEGDNIAPRYVEQLTVFKTGHAYQGEAVAVRLALRKFQSDHLRIKDSALRSAFTYSPEMQNLIDVAEDSHGLSKDPMKYWDDEKNNFGPVLPTESEIEAIYKRAEIRVTTEEEADFYRATERVVNMANARNEKVGFKAVKLADITSGGHSMYRGLIRIKPAGPHPLDLEKFAVNHAQFEIVRHEFWALDEAGQHLD